MRETDFIGGFAKGLRVIEAFGEAKPRLTITDVANETGLDRATARRCLLTLSELGYAHYDGKYFELTPRILRLGHAYLSATTLPRLIQPFLDRLSEKVGQSASASVLDGNEIVYVARASQKRVMSINLMAGSRLPAYCTSMGRVLLANLSPSEAYHILETSDRRKLTENTVTDIAALRVELDRARAQGYAVNNQEIELGLCSIGVPLMDRKGRVVGAINIGAPAAAVPGEQLAERFLSSMLEVQSAVQPLLG
jgi:IclR family pca regulon transcriptional regulator